MTASNTTSAGRLRHLLAEIQSIRDDQMVALAWSEVLRIPAERWAELLHAYSLVVNLPGEITAEVERIDKAQFNYELAMRWCPAVVSALEVDFARNVALANVKQRYSAETLFQLELCDDVLRRHGPARSPLQESDLERITARVDDLERDLAEGPVIDPELRAFLLLHARAMAQAIRDAPVRGSAGLEEALDQALGDVFVRRPDLLQRVKRVSPDRAGKFLAVIQAVVLALQITLTSLQIEQTGGSQGDGRTVVQVDLKETPALPAPPTVPPSSSEPTASPDGTTGTAHHRDGK
jgi:hypothetical protein